MNDWTWDPVTRTYRNTETGEVLTADDLVAQRDAIGAHAAELAVALWLALETGTITVWQWEAAMAEQQAMAIQAQYLLGVGGVQAFALAGAVAATHLGDLIAASNAEVAAFAASVNAGQLTAGTAQSYAASLAGSTVRGFDAGRGGAFGVWQLPAYPGDGSTECARNCKCYWEFVEVPGGVDCFWRLASGADHCGGCLAYADNYAPYFVAGATPADL
jgi:hypothetical protein